jgi:glycosyltransferase involved in cell wall biosynthesis
MADPAAQAIQPLIVETFFTFDAGGSQVRFAQIANHFGGAFRYAVMAMDGRYGCAAHLESHVEVTFPPVHPVKGRFFANRRRFRRQLLDLRPDLLITHNWGTIEWALANIPHVAPHIHIEDGFGLDEAKQQLRRRVWMRRLALRNSVVLLPTRNLYRTARETWRLPESCLRYIPNGVDCARFDAPPDRTRTRLWRGEGPVVGMVCALRIEKNVPRLLRAFAAVTRILPCRLVIVGDGAERPGIESLIVELELQSCVTLVGHVSDPEQLYSAFDIFALSSDTEQMPYSVLEAMAAGRPVVSTDVGDIADMVSSENRSFIVACDDGALAGAIRTLLGNADLRRRIGDANKLKAHKTYDQQGMFDAYLALYRSLIGSRNRPKGE